MVYKKIKQGIEFTVNKSAEFANEQQQKWEKKEKQKQHPDILQKGIKTYADIVTNVKLLPNEWKIVLEPLTLVAKAILDEVEDDSVIETSKAESSTIKASTVKASPIESVHQPTKLNRIRPFFNHSLNAFLQFTQKIRTDYKTMDNDDNEKARQNLNIIKADLLSHQKTLSNARKMDFDVTMDVIKARLRR
ncbi:MAG: hypothetical protein V3V19_02345 [Cocleimonas sp.]